MFTGDVMTQSRRICRIPSTRENYGLEFHSGKKSALLLRSALLKVCRKCKLRCPAPERKNGVNLEYCFETHLYRITLLQCDKTTYLSRRLDLGQTKREGNVLVKYEWVSNTGNPVLHFLRR